MNTMLKWIGGTTAAMMLALGAFAYGPRVTAERASAATGEDAATKVPAAAPANREKSTATAADADAPDPFTIKSILPVAGVMKYGEWHWDADAAPAEGKLVVTVDLKARVVSVFRDGHEIGTAVAMLGTEEHPTPVGQFPILWKQRHNVSEKYGNAPMPWSMFLTSDGIAIHGGSEVENGYASHGCIAVPDQFVEKLFAIAEKGDLVVITDGKMVSKGDSLL